jgi:hypothetical protein
MDQELIEHLDDKVSADSARSHPLIDLFIPTIDSEHGICSTHPEKLPGETPIDRLLAQNIFLSFYKFLMYAARPGIVFRQYCRYHTEWPKQAFLPAQL